MSVASAPARSAIATAAPLQIDIVVHGRFHAFHLARALLARGHDVRLLTNYPRWAAARFGVPGDCVSSFVLHGVARRIHSLIIERFGAKLGEPWLHTAFGQWAARHVRWDADLIYVFSGVGEELLNVSRLRRRPHVWLARGSSHIRTQHSLLCEEEARVGVPLEKPTPWSIDREEREYVLADRIVTLSTFSYSSFRDRPALAHKTLLLLAAVDTSRFRPADVAITDRLQRIEAGMPLRVLTVGAFSFRKGAQDLITVAMALRGRMQFRFVGDLPAETRNFHRRARAVIDLHPRVAEFELVDHYDWADIFLFPTIEDGFPAVVAQAQAAGLAVITTPNGSGPDIIRSGETGWIVPIRDPDAITKLLRFCDAQRADLARVTRSVIGQFEPRDWSAMARDLEAAFAGAQPAAMTG